VSQIALESSSIGHAYPGGLFSWRASTEPRFAASLFEFWIGGIGRVALGGTPSADYMRRPGEQKRGAYFAAFPFPLTLSGWDSYIADGGQVIS
jgi:hypothetical protein